MWHLNFDWLHVTFVVMQVDVFLKVKISGGPPATLCVAPAEVWACRWYRLAPSSLWWQWLASARRWESSQPHQLFVVGVLSTQAGWLDRAFWFWFGGHSSWIKRRCVLHERRQNKIPTFDWVHECYLRSYEYFLISEEELGEHYLTGGLSTRSKWDLSRVTTHMTLLSISIIIVRSERPENAQEVFVSRSGELQLKCHLPRL